MAMNPRSKCHGVPTANDPITTRITVLSYTQKRSNDRTYTEASVKGAHQTDTNYPAQPIVLMATTGLLEHLKDRFILDSACNTYPPDAATL